MRHRLVEVLSIAGARSGRYDGRVNSVEEHTKEYMKERQPDGWRSLPDGGTTSVPPN
jgi:hypothetical protein